MKMKQKPYPNKAERGARLAGIGLTVASAFALLMLGGCRKLILGSDAMRETATEVVASSGTGWTCKVSEESKRTVGDLADPTRLDISSSSSSSSSAMSSMSSATAPSIPMWLSNSVHATATHDTDDASIYYNLFSGTPFYLCDESQFFAGAELTIVTKDASLADGGTVTGIYGSAGSIKIPSIGISLPGAVRFWFAQGSYINETLEANGCDTLPLLDGSDHSTNRTYLVIMASQALLMNSLMSAASNFMKPMVLILDPYDPSLYIGATDTIGKIVKSMKSKSGDKSKDETSKSNDEKLADSGKANKFSIDKIKGVGLSYQGLLPVRRQTLWPFNQTLDGVVFTDDYGELIPSTDKTALKAATLKVDPDLSSTIDTLLANYKGPQDGMSITKGVFDKATKTYTKSTDALVFQYGDVDEATYGTSGDTKDDGIPIIALSSAYLKYGGIELLKVCGLPVTLEGDIGLTVFNKDIPTYTSSSEIDPGVGSSAFEAADQTYFRAIANAKVIIGVDPDKSKFMKFLSTILAKPELGEGTVFFNGGPNRSYLYASLKNDGTKTIDEFLNLSLLGSFSDKVQPILSKMIVSEDPDYKLALFFDTTYGTSDDRSAFMFRAHANFDYNPTAIIDSTVSAITGEDFSINPLKLKCVGDIAFGYSDFGDAAHADMTGLYLNATVTGGFELPFGSDGFDLSADADATFSCWIRDYDDWGIHFDTKLGVQLPFDMGSFTLATAQLDFNSENIYLYGALDLGLKVSDFTIFNATGFVQGFIDYQPFYMSLAGALDVTLLECLEAKLTASIDTDEGLALAGTVDLKVGSTDLGNITVSGKCNPSKPSFELKGSASLSFGSGGKLSLANTQVAISNDGAFVSGSLGIPGFGANIAVSGAISSSGFSFTGHTDLTIAGYTLTGVDVVFSDKMISLSGQLAVPGVLTTTVTGALYFQNTVVNGTTYTAGTMILKGSGDVTIGSYHLFTAAISFEGNMFSSTPYAKVSVNSSLTLQPLASITVDGSFSASTAGISGSLTGTASAQASLSTSFSVCGFNLVFGFAASASLQVTFAFSISSSGAVSVTLRASGGAKLSITFPWVEITWKSVKVSLGFLGSITIYYPDFSWTNKTVTIVDFHVEGSIGTDGLSASVTLGSDTLLGKVFTTPIGFKLKW